MKKRKYPDFCLKSILFITLISFFNVCIYADASPLNQTTAAPVAPPTPAAPDAVTVPSVPPTSAARDTVTVPAATAITTPPPPASAPTPNQAKHDNPISDYELLTTIAASFEQLKSKNIYIIKDSRISNYLRSNFGNYIYNKKYQKAKKKMTATMETVEKSSSLNNTEAINSINVMLLDKSKLLVTVPFYISSYQTSALFFIYDAKDIKITAAPFEPEDGADYSEYSFSNIIPISITENNILQITSKARAAGDCGIIGIYKYINDFFKIMNQNELPCE